MEESAYRDLMREELLAARKTQNTKKSTGIGTVAVTLFLGMATIAILLFHFGFVRLPN